jgi:hypothetical protein
MLWLVLRHLKVTPCHPSSCVFMASAMIGRCEFFGMERSVCFSERVVVIAAGL